MNQYSIEAIIQALNEDEVKYLVVGGLAVVAHGYVRFTADVDLILDLQVDNLSRAVVALQRLGYSPRAPVKFEEFIDASKRAQWIQEKQLTVFSLFSPRHPLTEVDLFVENLLDFDRAYARAMRQEMKPGLTVTFIALLDLLNLKRQAGRPQDLMDIEHLMEKPRAQEVIEDG